jgi:ribosomal protein RSM22 (predicted rRNA methylase)
MTTPDLPAELKAALDAKLLGLSRNDAAARAALISKTYREGGNSAAIASEADALAYALARMPATYAAVTASLNALCEISPHFAPKSLLDVGAGPGTATWAAVETFTSLKTLTLVDANSALRALALDLGRGSARLHDLKYQRSNARAALADNESADLVVASYMIGEISEQEQSVLAALLWSKTRDTLLVVEPGTPAGYGRIIALREQLIAAAPMSRPPARTTANVRFRHTTGAISPSACRARARISRSREPNFPSRTRSSAMSR